MNTISIGNCSGYYGDRISAMHEMLEGGHLDYLTGDYLAELTMLILGRDRLKDPTTGYAKTFLRQLGDSLALARERKVRIVANAGGLNPAGLASAIRELAKEQGLDVAVAHVEGDDVRKRAAELGVTDALTANAYLGGFGIAAALQRGADIVVTGRVTDASVVVGPGIAEFGWTFDDVDPLAGAVVAGHIIECGTQATGGNFSGFRSLDLSRPFGFPIAELHADGSSVITKHEDTGGAVTVDTVTAQLVYEIQDSTYLNPDVTVHMDTIELSQESAERVAVTAVRGSRPPATTKVGINRLGGHRNTVEFILTGLDIEAKADWVKDQMEAGLAVSPPDSVVWDLQRTEHEDPDTQAAGATLLRCHAISTKPEPVGRSFSNAAIEIALASYPGFHVTAPPGRGAPYGVFTSAYLPQNEVPHLVIHADGETEEIAPPTQVADVPADPVAEAVAAPEAANTVRVPLGRIAHARSGDKGGNANVGVWIGAEHPHPERAYAWLCHAMTPERLAELLPEAHDLPIRVTRLPHLRAVNIIIEGLLGEGVAASTRHDPQAKAVGEWLRARHIDVDPELIND